MARRGAFTMGALMLLVTACAAPVNPGSQPERTPDSVARSTTQCADAPAALLDRIAQGLTVDGGGSLTSGQAVRSGDFEEVWFVAAEIDGPGLESPGDIGVWATNAIDSIGLTFAVNAVATTFSDWGDGGGTDARMTMASDGAAAALACVG